MKRSDKTRLKYSKLLSEIIYEMTANNKHINDINISALLKRYNCGTVTRELIENALLRTNINESLAMAAETLRTAKIDYNKESLSRVILISGKRKKRVRKEKELFLKPYYLQ